jgi:hypothetical protein
VFYLVLLLIPFAQIAAACSAGEVTRTLWSAGISVLLIFSRHQPSFRNRVFDEPLAKNDDWRVQILLSDRRVFIGLLFRH